MDRPRRRGMRVRGSGKRVLNMNYSVLMSVYYKEKPEFLRQSMESILAQTVVTDDFVLVCDGPLTTELDNVIASFQQRMGGILHVVKLEKNGGLGNALNVGIKQCKNELVARMDSDDIAHPDRCEKQLRVFQTSDVDIVSGTVEEFSVAPDTIDAKRVLPETHAEIIEFAKRRNPFNHPCVMYKKSVVEAAGGYQDMYLLEDYYLWLRMLQNGSKGYNLQEPLLWMRGGSEMYKRRSGWKYAKAQRALFCYMKDKQFISFKQYIISCMVRTVSSCAPNWLREGVFRVFLRE